MGVHGLWRLIEPSGKKVPLETLENKVLAVDISIWLHQAIKGFQDSRGAPVPNAHLLGVYHRVCKLLYYRIRPVFVFDGGVPILKKQTIAKRNQQKNKYEDESTRLHQQILSTLLKHSAVSTALIEKEKLSPSKNKPSPTKQNRVCNDDELFKLPELPNSQQAVANESESDSDSSDSDYIRPRIDIDSIDEKSHQFKSLPADIRHDILTELKENSKVSSWHKIRQMPSESGDFSSFQIKRLLKKHSIQVSLEEAEKEMGGHTLSLGDLEALLTEEGIVTASKSSAMCRIASDENTKYLLIKDIQKAIIKAKQDQEAKEKAQLEKDNKEEIPDMEIIKEESEVEASSSSKNDRDIHEAMFKISEYERDLQNAIKLSLTKGQSTISNEETNVEKKTSSYLENFNDLDFVSDTSSDEERVSPIKKSNHPAKAYMVEYSDLTPAEIDNILGTNSSNVNMQKYFMNEMLLNTPRSSQNKTKEHVEEKTNKISENIEIKMNTEHPQMIPSANVKKSLFSNPSDSLDRDNSEHLKILNIENDVDASVSIMSESEESDEFVDVPEEEAKNKSKHKPSLEIVIQSNSEPTDDLFADVFSEPNKKTDILEIKDKSIITSFKDKNIEEHTEDIIMEDIPTKNSNTIKEPISKHEIKDEGVVVNKIDQLTDESSLKMIDEPNTVNKNDDNEEVDKTDVFIKEKQIEKIKRPILTSEELKSMKDTLEKEQHELISEKAHQDRLANSITDQMYREAQELLELFGLPYIVAPMEAEAQCAFLESIKLTDGTITDDSDIWLFGGRTVYKNFFNHKKQVLEFHNDNIKHYFKLTRQQLILLALLVGSDYTIGIQGVGPVTALEILAAFPPSKTDFSIISQDELLSGLIEFRNWWHSGKPAGPRKTTLRSKLKNVTLNEGFPNLQVVNAYLQPEVETSKEKFSWGKPNVNKLIEFARLKFGWSEVKSKEIVLPIMKRLEDEHAQKSIKAYFAARPTVMSDKKMSKRVIKAVERIGNANESSEDDLNDIPPTKKIASDAKEKLTAVEESVKSSQVKQIKKKTAPRKSKLSTVHEPKVVTLDVDIKPLKKLETKVQSSSCTSKRYEEIIPQREQDKLNALNTKLKAIETYRKSKRGPGYVQKKQKVARKIKEDAELSESSSDE